VNGDKQNELAMKKWLHLPREIYGPNQPDAELFGRPVELKSSVSDGVQIGRDISFTFYRKYVTSIFVAAFFSRNKISEIWYLGPEGRRKVLHRLFMQLSTRSTIVRGIYAVKPIIFPLIRHKVSVEEFNRAIEDIRRVRAYRITNHQIRLNGIRILSPRHFRALVRKHEK
jgi:hypothetical protein